MAIGEMGTDRVKETFIHQELMNKFRLYFFLLHDSLFSYSQHLMCVYIAT